jgi:hypothetical protein
MTALPRTRRLLACGVAAAVTGTGALAAVPAAQAADATTRASAPAARQQAVTSTTRLVLDPATSQYGAPVTATATVTSPGAAPAGSVSFVLDGVATTVPTDTAGVAELVVDDTRVGDHTISATFAPSDPTLVTNSSSGPRDLVVTKAPARTRVSVPRTRAGERTRAVVRVAGAHKTRATGRVKIVVRKVGRPGVEQRRYGALLKERRGFFLGRLEAGRYTVKATYLGDLSHRRSSNARWFTVRR